jgi:3(or 17)beta-hydroxysteroid dehydrogenase
MNRVAGKVAVISGAASGLGKATAMLLAQEGAQVIIADINETGGAQVAADIQKQGGQAIFVKLDVTSETDWKNVMQTTLERFKKLDILVNCAGIFYSNKIEDISLEDWRRVIAVNLDGTFLGIKSAIGPMKQNGGGSIINLSSTGGIVGTVDSSPYNASKGGVRVFTKAAAMEFSKMGHDYNIRVNSVHPGFMRTPMTEWAQKDPRAAEPITNEIPYGKMGEPEDVAYGILYLASDEAKYITGAELVIDGGWTIH